jgi:hypothetical protein
MVEPPKECGGDVKLTIYPEANHDAWTETYANPELYHVVPFTHEKTPVRKFFNTKTQRTPRSFRKKVATLGHLGWNLLI